MYSLISTIEMWNTHIFVSVHWTEPNTSTTKYITEGYLSITITINQPCVHISLGTDLFIILRTNWQLELVTTGGTGHLPTRLRITAAISAAATVLLLVLLFLPILLLLVESVKCYPGGGKFHFIPSISEILSQRCYYCVHYTRNHLISLISHCWLGLLNWAC